MNELKRTYIVYAIIALLCIVPEVIGINGLIEQGFEYGSQFSGVRVSFKINMGFILFGAILQITIVASILATRNDVYLQLRLCRSKLLLQFIASLLKSC